MIVTKNNRLAIGTAQFGMPYGIANRFGKVPSGDIRAILKLASESNIDTLDTAISYGESESCLGAIGVNKFRLITKLPPVPEGCVDVELWVRHQVDASLLRLGVNAVDGLLLHAPNQLLYQNGAKIYRALQELKISQKVRKIGVSIYSPNELSAILPFYSFDLIQAPFNLVDQRMHSSGWLRRLKDDGIEIHVRSAFLQGLLLMSQVDIPVKFSRWDAIWKMWHGWLSASGVSALEACLWFSLSFPEIDRVVVGIDNASHLAQIIGAYSNQCSSEFPALFSEDENLINPAQWNRL